MNCLYNTAVRLYGGVAQQQHDGPGFAQLVFEHQVTVHLRHEQEAGEQQGGEDTYSYELLFTGQWSEGCFLDFVI